MKIDRIEIYRVSMPLVYPWRTAIGNTDRIESILLQMHSQGLHGWSESAPWQDPGYCPEWTPAQFLLLRDRLAPLLLGQDIGSAEELQARLALIKGNNFAKASLDLAWWDLHARSRGEPLWKTIGGRGPVIEVGADFGAMESIDLLLKTIDAALKQGFKRVKLKFRPGWDLEMIAAARRAFPDAVFHVDCNSAYTLADAPMLQRLDEYNLAMIEQPLMHDDLVDHAALQRRLATPICLDESITSPDKARKAIEIGACRWINIKHGRVGGLTAALKIHNLCAEKGIGVWMGGMLESAVGQAFAVALATLPNAKYPSDVFPSERFYASDLSRPQVKMSGPSQITAEPGPGIGVEPDPGQLNRLTLERAVLHR